MKARRGARARGREAARCATCDSKQAHHAARGKLARTRVWAVCGGLSGRGGHHTRITHTAFPASRRSARCPPWRTCGGQCSRLFRPAGEPPRQLGALLRRCNENRAELRAHRCRHWPAQRPVSRYRRAVRLHGLPQQTQRAVRRRYDAIACTGFVNRVEAELRSRWLDRVICLGPYKDGGPPLLGRLGGALPPPPRLEHFRATLSLG